MRPVVTLWELVVEVAEEGVPGEGGGRAPLDGVAGGAGDGGPVRLDFGSVDGELEAGGLREGVVVLDGDG